jgi:uncharacterized RDD family membrane protein YckC
MSAQLVTGEAVALDVRTAGLASRLLAALLDGLIQFMILFALMFLVGAFGGGGSPAALAALGVVAFVTAGLGYPVLCETLMRGRTPGKMALGLRVVRDDAGPIGFRQAFVRGLIGFIVERPGITFYSAAVIASLANESGKRLGDIFAGTVVIQERVIAPDAVVVPMPPPLAGWATTVDLSRLPDDLALAVRTFLARSGSMTDTARAELGNRLAAAVSAVVTPPPPPGTPGWAYLSAVLAERRARAQAQQGLGYGAPAYGAPGYGAPAYGAPGYGAPAYGAPGYGAPAYGAPGYGAPAYGAPGYGAPAYGTAAVPPPPALTTGAPEPARPAPRKKTPGKAEPEASGFAPPS